MGVKPDPGIYDINNLNLMLYLTNFLIEKDHLGDRSPEKDCC